MLRVGNFGKYSDSMQNRSFNGGLQANMTSFWALSKNLVRVDRFAWKEALAYPLWRVFCDKNMFNRYKLKY